MCLQLVTTSAVFRQRKSSDTDRMVNAQVLLQLLHDSCSDDPCTCTQFVKSSDKIGLGESKKFTKILTRWTFTKYTSCKNVYAYGVMLA